MALLFSNNASGTLATTLGIGDSTLVLSSGEGLLFPTPTGGDTFLVTIQDSLGDLEICECTSKSSDILTITRARESTAAHEFAAGAVVEMRVTAGLLGTFVTDAALADYITTAAAESNYLRKDDNLDDVTNPTTARTNLGLGTAAVEADTKYAHRANNLSDLAAVATARTNLGLGAIAVEAVPLAVAKGGTGAITAEAARTSLGVLGAGAGHWTRAAALSVTSTDGSLIFDTLGFSTLTKGTYSVVTGLYTAASATVTLLVTVGIKITSVGPSGIIESIVKGPGTTVVARGASRSDAGSSSHDLSANVTSVVRLTTGQTMSAYVYSSATKNLDTNSAYTYLDIVELG